MTEIKYRQHHDMGGQAAGPVDLHEHEIALWEKRIEAIMRLLQLREQPILRVDELRRGIESLDPDVYDKLTYYEKWITSLTNLLVEKGVLSRAEIDARIAAIKARGDRLP